MSWPSSMPATLPEPTPPPGHRPLPGVTAERSALPRVSRAAPEDGRYPGRCAAGVLAHRPRAYVGAPVAPATGLFRVIDWAFDQATDLTWGDLRILVPDPTPLTRLSPLQRLTSRGVRIGTADQAAGARSFHGMVIAYCPDATMLTAAEALPGVRVVAAVALHNDQLVEWVDTYAPQHLGGDIVSTLPEATAPTRLGHALQPSS